MTKKIIIIIVFVCILFLYGFYALFTVFQSIKTVEQQAPTHAYNNKQDTVILWDLHQVVFERNLSNWLWLFLKNAQLFSIIRHLDMLTTKIMVQFILKKCHLTHEEVTSEELISAARISHNNALIDLIITISCAYYPNQKVVTLIEQLHKEGYVQHVGSNIGNTVFNRFKMLFPSLFSLFQDVHIVHIEKNNVVIKKPNAIFFTRYLEKQNLVGNQVIFIDDRPANVANAQAQGIIGILFKNAEQLRQDLLYLGILKK